MQHFYSGHAPFCAILNDMCMRRMQETAIARVSDDFYPRNSASSHPHIAACAFNGFFMSAILHVSELSLSACLLMLEEPAALPDVTAVSPKVRLVLHCVGLLGNMACYQR